MESCEGFHIYDKELIEDDGRPESLRYLYVEQEEERRARVRQLAELGLIKRRKYIGTEDARRVWVQVLNTGDSAADALTAVATRCNYPTTWISDVKGSPVHQDIVTTLLRDTVDHPTMQAMHKEGLLSYPGKRALRSARTLSSTLNTLSHLVNLALRIRDLQAENEQLKARLDRRPLFSDKKEEKLQATRLYQAGTSKRQIAKMLGRSPDTISRWLRSGV